MVGRIGEGRHVGGSGEQTQTNQEAAHPAGKFAESGPLHALGQAGVHPPLVEALAMAPAVVPAGVEQNPVEKGEGEAEHVEPEASAADHAVADEARAAEGAGKDKARAEVAANEKVWEEEEADDDELETEDVETKARAAEVADQTARAAVEAIARAEAEQKKAAAEQQEIAKTQAAAEEKRLEHRVALGRLMDKRVGSNAYLPEGTVPREGGAVSAIFVIEPNVGVESLVAAPGNDLFYSVHFRQPVEV